MLEHHSVLIHDFHRTKKCKEDWFGENGLFKGDVRLVPLSASTDSLNPWKAMGSNYLMWPLTLQVLNFPPALRKSVGGIQLVGIIPGNGTNEPESLEPYVKVLVDELLSLSGCEIYDAFRNEDFELKVEVL